MNFQKLLMLAEVAKRMGIADIGNVVFAVMLGESVKRKRISYQGSNEDRIWVQVQTQDPDGLNPPQAKYDVVDVCYTPAPHSLIVFSVSMPAPMLCPYHWIAAVKRQDNLIVIPKEPMPAEQLKVSAEGVWAEIRQLLPEKNEVASAVLETFAQIDGWGQPLRERLFEVVLANWGSTG